MYELLKSCWHECPSQRPSFSQTTKTLLSIWETFENMKFQQFLPKNTKAEEKEENNHQAKSLEKTEPYIEMKLKPNTIDSYVQLSHNGYNICLMDGQIGDENENVRDGVFL